MRSPISPKLLATACLAAVVPTGFVDSLAAQERVLSGADRSYFDARFSPDGKWISYQADGSVRIIPSSGGGESIAYTAGRSVSYLWESGSASLLVTTGDKLIRTTRDGKTQRQIANLTGKNVLDLYAVVGNYAICIRRNGTARYVSRIDTTNGKLSDIITKVPGVTSLDVDKAGKTIVLSDEGFVFQWSFWRANVDGSGLTVITGQPLTALARNARWLDSNKTLVIEHVGLVGNFGGGWQMWEMNAFNGNAQPISWQPRYRRGAPAVSPDGRWVATFELQATGDVRAVVMPAQGGAEYVLSPSLPVKTSDTKISWSPDSKSVIYTGTTDPKRKGDVRVFDFDRPLYLAPSPRPGQTSPFTLPLKASEAGVVFLGVRAAKGLTIPGLSGQLMLDLAAFPPVVLGSAAAADLKGIFVTPNQTTLVGIEVSLQGLRLNVGQGLSGGFDLASFVAIHP